MIFKIDMTYRDIFNQILSEVTGKSQDQIDDLWKAFLASNPGPGRLDEELPDETAQKLLRDLRKDKAGILAWLADGSRKVHKHTGRA